MVVRVKWFYHPEETQGCPNLKYPVSIQLKLIHFVGQITMHKKTAEFLLMTWIDIKKWQFNREINNFFSVFFFCLLHIRVHYLSHRMRMKMTYKQYPTNVKYFRWIHTSKNSAMSQNNMNRFMIIMTHIILPVAMTRLFITWKCRTISQ